MAYLVKEQTALVVLTVEHLHPEQVILEVVAAAQVVIMVLELFLDHRVADLVDCMAVAVVLPPAVPVAQSVLSGQVLHVHSHLLIQETYNETLY